VYPQIVPGTLTHGGEQSLAFATMAEVQAKISAAAIPLRVLCFYVTFGDPAISAGDFNGRSRAARNDDANVMMVSVKADPGTPYDVVVRAQQVLTRAVFTNDFVADGYRPAAYLLPITTTSTTSTTTTFTVPESNELTKEPVSTTSLAIGISLAIVLVLSLTCGIWYGVNHKKLGEIVQASDLVAKQPAMNTKAEAIDYAAAKYAAGLSRGEYRVPNSPAYGQGGRASVSPGRQSANYLEMDGGGGGSVYGGMAGSYLEEYSQPEPYARMSPQDTRGLEGMLGTRWSNEDERFARPTRYQANPLVDAMRGDYRVPGMRPGFGLGGVPASANSSPGGPGYFNVGSIYSPTSNQMPRAPPTMAPRPSFIAAMEGGGDGGGGGEPNLMDEVTFSNMVGAVWNGAGAGLQYNSSMPMKMGPDPLNSAYSTAYSAAPYGGGGEYASVIGALGGADFEAPQPFVAGGSIRPAIAMLNGGFMQSEAWPTINDFADDSAIDYGNDVELGGDVLSSASRKPNTTHGSRDPHQSLIATDYVFNSMDANQDGVLSLDEFRVGTRNTHSEAGITADANNSGSGSGSDDGVSVARQRSAANEGRRSITSMMSVEEEEERDLAGQESTKPTTSLRPDEEAFGNNRRGGSSSNDRGVPRADSSHFYPAGSSMHQGSVLNAQLTTLM